MKKISPFVTLFFLLSATTTGFSQWQLTGNNNATPTSILGTTTAIPLRLHTNNIPRLVIDANGRVGIGTSTPVNNFMIQTSGVAPTSSWVGSNAALTAFGENAVGNADFAFGMASNFFNGRPTFLGRRSRGTLGAPTVVNRNDLLMSFLGSGHDGSSFQNSAAIDFYVDGNPSAGNMPARISIATGNSSSSRVERLKIAANGDITFNTNQLFMNRTTGNTGLGTITPAAKLDVLGTLKVTDGTQGIGKFLTSDANGLASWTSINNLPTGTASQTLRNNGSAWVPSSLLVNNGNSIGVGEAAPVGMLHISQPYNFAGVTFTGTGLNDMTANNSGYNGTGNTSYAIRIQNAGPTPNLIEKSTDGGTTWGAPENMSNNVDMGGGVIAQFDNVTGHTFGDRWDWTVGPSYNNTVVVRDGKVGIGTFAPAATLDLKGDALINGLTLGRGAGNRFSNTAFGVNALTSNTTGATNVGIGSYSLKANTTGYNNTAVGYYSLSNVTEGNSNVGIGQYSLFYVVGTNSNTAIGYSAGDYTDNPTNCTFLGYNTTATSNLVNTTVIGNGAFGAASNSVRVGNTAVNSIGGQVGWTTFSDGRYKKNVEENVPGLSFINKLRPVTYNLNVAGIDNRISEISSKLSRREVSGKMKPIVTEEELQAKKEKEAILHR